MLFHTLGLMKIQHAGIAVYRCGDVALKYPEVMHLCSTFVLSCSVLSFNGDLLFIIDEIIKRCIPLALFRLRPSETERLC